MYPAFKLFGACRGDGKLQFTAGFVDSALFLTLSLRETKNLHPLNDMPHCEKGKRRSHATTQRKSACDGCYGNVQVHKLMGRADFFSARRRSL